MLYGAQTWGLRSTERRKVDVIDMRYWRSFVGMSRMNRVRNEEARAKSHYRKGVSE